MTKYAVSIIANFHQDRLFYSDTIKIVHNVVLIKADNIDQAEAESRSIALQRWPIRCGWTNHKANAIPIEPFLEYHND